MENTRKVRTGLSVIDKNDDVEENPSTDDTKLPPYVLITLNQEGQAAIRYSRILDRYFICDILRSALDQMEYLASEEDEVIYTEH